MTGLFGVVGQMSQVPPPSRARPSRTLSLALIGVAALLYGIAGCSKTTGDLKSLAKGAMAKLIVTEHPAPAPAMVFADTSGKPHTLADFKGKVAIVNVWANWCSPCKAEIT